MSVLSPLGSGSVNCGSVDGKRVARAGREKHEVRRARSALVLFTEASRERIKLSRAGAKYAEVTRLASAEWKAMSFEARAEWEKAAVDDKLRYERERAALLTDRSQCASGAAGVMPAAGLRDGAACRTGELDEPEVVAGLVLQYVSPHVALVGKRSPARAKRLAQSAETGIAISTSLPTSPLSPGSPPAPPLPPPPPPTSPPPTDNLPLGWPAEPDATVPSSLGTTNRPQKTFLVADGVARVPVTLWAAEPTSPDRSRPIATGSTTGLVGCVIPWGEITVGRQLGAGGFGVVFAATWRHDDVAVKKIRPELIASQGEAARSEFRRELELLCSLRHRHIVQCYGGDATDHFFVVTELMERGSLDDCLEAHAAEFAWARLGRRTLLDVAKGLLYLHGRGLVHFDVSRSAG